MTHEWGLLIVLYLFLGGLSAGLLAISAAATLWAPLRLDRAAEVAAWAAPWPVLGGTALLVLDLGRPLFFWKLLVAFQPASPMWIGTWLLSLFSVASLAYAATFLPSWLFASATNRVLAWRERLAAACLPIAVGVALYTGVLLGVLVARPLWNTPLLAQVFVVSAVSTAAALLILLLRGPGAAAQRRVLARADAALIVLELVIIGWMFLEARTSPVDAGAGLAILGRGLYAWVFWGGVVLIGLVLPLALEVVEILDPRQGRIARFLPRAVVLVPALVLAGGLLLRWVIVYAGQASSLG